MYWGYCALFPYRAPCRYRTGTGTRQHDGQKPWLHHFFSTAPDSPHLQKQGLYPRRPQIIFPCIGEDWKDSSGTCHTCRAPGTLHWAVMHFWKRPRRKEPELKKELDGTKPILGHDFGECSSQQPMWKAHGIKAHSHQPDPSLPFCPLPHGTQLPASVPSCHCIFILHKVLVSLSCSPWKALLAETARIVLERNR